MNFHRLMVLSALLAATPAFAQWPDKPKTETKTESKAEAKPEAKAETPPPPPSRRARAAADEDTGSGFGFGLRAAWAMPSGNLTNTDTLGSEIDRQIPVWVEAGYHINRNLFAGAYFQWAPGFLTGAHCFAGASCSANGMKFGIEALWNFMPTSFLQPWAGLGVGYEIFNDNRSGAERTFKGLELLNLQVGADLALSKNFSIGPFASYSLLGKFSSFTSSGVSNDIQNASGHSWLQLGLKAGFKL